MNDRELFITALQLKTSEERTAYLNEACGTDQERRQRIEKLLQRHEESESFLNPDHVERTAAFEHISAGKSEPTPLETAGDQIGPFKLLQKLGDGGMGTVWVAEQEKPVKRRVALKLVKAGMDSAEVLRRFEAERQALAMMDHTNIAKVFDAGTNAQGRPYFVMELIKGVPITKYCDEVHASIRDRLDLFIQVCAAVQHAHQKGIIHRDIKPSNVLVAMQDGKPVPKVIDFGVAKALHSKLADKTMYTEIGQVVGTLEYMAPEQAELSAMDIDTRADIYALGILLYELLTGSTPITRQRMKSAAFAEILRIIKEEEPAKPSTRLSESKESMASVASLRRTDPRHLSTELRGELDWVVMKALEKDRTRRYETANGLSRDLQRYLTNETVEARPPSAGYRLRKFVQRNRPQVIAASLVMVALIAGVIGTTLGWQEARRQTEIAREQEAEARKQEGLARAETAAKELARAEEAMQRKRAVEFRDKALDALRATTGPDVEHLIGGKKELGANEKAYLEAIVKRWQAFAQQEGTDEHSRAIRAEGHSQVARLWQKLGRREEALSEYEQAIAIQEKLSTDFPTLPGYRFTLTASHLNLGDLLAKLGKRTEAQEQYHKAILFGEKLAADFPAMPDCRSNLAASHINLGSLLTNLGNWAEAEKQVKQGFVIQEKLVVDFPDRREYRSNLAASHRHMAILLDNLGKPAAAEEQVKKTLEILERLAADFPTVPDYRRALVSDHCSLGFLLGKLRKRAEAQEQFQKAIMLGEKLVADFPAVPDNRFYLALSHGKLGLLLVGLGQRDEAQQQYSKALAIQEKLAADFPAMTEYRIELGGIYCGLGELVRNKGQASESLGWFDKAIVILTLAHRHDPRDVTTNKYLRASHGDRAFTYDQLKRHGEAAKDWDLAIALSPPAEQTPFLNGRVMSWLQAGKVAEAVAEVDKLSKIPSIPAPILYDFACVYSVASSKIADKKQEYADRAMELLQKAVKAGFKNAAHMKKDTDLDPMRDREDFKKLLAELTKLSSPTIPPSNSSKK